MLPKFALDNGVTYNLKLAASDEKGEIEVGVATDYNAIKRVPGHTTVDSLLDPNLLPLNF